MVAACPLGDGSSVSGCALRPPGCSNRESGRRGWRGGGDTALASKGPGGAICRLNTDQLERLRSELARGPAVHGWADQRWTLARITLLIGRLFHIRYTLRGTSYLLHRIGLSPQVPARRAAERDEAKIATWRTETWAKVRG